MDGHYLSRGRLEEMIREAEKGDVKKVLHLLYETRHDVNNYRDKYSD